MKKIFSLALLAVAVFAGCTTSQTGASSAAAPRRFYDGKAADLIVEFNSWEYTYLNRPEITDGAYRREVSTNELGAILTGRHVPRKLAVVKLGWLFELKSLEDTMNRWDAVLNQLSFERVVYVRSNGARDLAGALILRDTQSKTNLPLEVSFPSPKTPPPFRS